MYCWVGLLARVSACYQYQAKRDDVLMEGAATPQNYYIFIYFQSCYSEDNTFGSFACISNVNIDDDCPQSANSQLMLSNDDDKQPVCTPLGFSLTSICLRHFVVSLSMYGEKVAKSIANNR